MKKLGATYKANQYDYQVLKREGNIVLSESEYPTHYEVFIVRKLPAKKVFDREYPEREAPPKNEDWGQFGWTFKTRENAEKKFSQLVKKHKKSVEGGQVI